MPVPRDPAPRAEQLPSRGARALSQLIWDPSERALCAAANEDGALALFPKDQEFVGAWRATLPLPFDRWGPRYKFTGDYHEPASLTFDVENAGVSPLYLVGGYPSMSER